MGITITRGASTSGRSSSNLRINSGMMFYGTAPSTSGWTTYTNPVTIKARQIFSAQDAYDKGITPYTDNVAAHGSIAWGTGSSLGTLAAGDIITITKPISVLGATTSIITLCTYTVITADVSDVTGATLAAAITSAINSLTFSTGFSSTIATNISTIIAPTSQGKYLNTQSVTVTISNGHTMTNTNTAFSAGTSSLFAVCYYQISEYYRKFPTGNLTVGFISASSSWKEVIALEIASGNEIRQTLIFDTNTSNGLAANILSTVESIQSTISTSGTPFEIIYQPNVIAVSDLSTMPNGNLNTVGTNVQVILLQDGLAQGNLLSTQSGYSIGCGGVVLGALSKSRISTSIAQPIEDNNLSDGVENNTPALANGQLLSAISVPLYQQLFGTTEINTSGYCYIGPITYPGNVSGTFVSGNAMFTAQSSDYAFMNDNRVWDDVTRICIQTYTPEISSEHLFNPDGTLSSMDILNLQAEGVKAITANMITGINPPYISATPIVTVDPTQKIRSTNVLLISVQITENGIARNIRITNGFTA